MSRKCRAFSESKLGLEPADNRKAFYAGWEAALAKPEVQSTHSAECYKWHHECARAEVERLRAALAEPVQPVAWMYVNSEGECEQIEYEDPPDDPSVTPLYTAPPRREWVSLTDKDFDAIHKRVGSMGYEYERAIEAALKEKNT